MRLAGKLAKPAASSTSGRRLSGYVWHDAEVIVNNSSALLELGKSISCPGDPSIPFRFGGQGFEEQHIIGLPRRKAETRSDIYRIPAVVLLPAFFAPDADAMINRVAFASKSPSSGQAAGACSSRMLSCLPPKSSSALPKLSCM